jgi:hypothetical protein
MSAMRWRTCPFVRICRCRRNDADGARIALALVREPEGVATTPPGSGARGAAGQWFSQWGQALTFAYSGRSLPPRLDYCASNSPAPSITSPPVVSGATSPLRKTDPLVLRKPDPGDAHSCVDSFPVAVERIVGGSLWTLWARGPRVWASRGQQGGWPRLAHTSRRARDGPQDSSTSPQARHGQAPWPTTCRTESMANGAGVQSCVSGIAKCGERTRAARFGGNMLLAGRRYRRIRPVQQDGVRP